jgi:hypothetical protein
VLIKEVVSGVLHPYNSNKTNAHKLEISTKIDVYSYRRAHRCASYSARVICRGCGVVRRCSGGHSNEKLKFVNLENKERMMKAEGMPS